MIYEGLVAYRNGNLKAIAVPQVMSKRANLQNQTTKIMKNLTALPM